MPATEVSIRHQPTLARSSTAHTSDSQACSPGSRPITFTGRLSRRRRPTREGDQVLGFDVRFRFGAHAEYVCWPADDLLALRPARLSHQEAVAIPYGGLLAMHFLRRGGVRRGHRIAVYGASGSIGTSAVQLAREIGATVTRV